MTQELDALLHHQSLVVAAHHKEFPIKTHRPVVVLPGTGGKADLHDLEGFMQGRSRFRGAMQTGRFADFVSYVAGKTKNGKAHGFINADGGLEKMSCCAYFNLGDEQSPGHGDDKAILLLKRTAAFTAIQQASSAAHDQKSLVEFIEDWSHCITGEDQDDFHMTAIQCVHAIRNLKLATAGEATSTLTDSSVQRTAMEKAEIKSADRLPKALRITAEPYLGFTSRVVVLRIAYHLGEKTPKLGLRVVQSEKLVEDIADEFKSKINDELGGLMDTLVVGTFTLGS